MKPYVVGITGGIASGKSVVSRRLEELGATVIDADILSREVISEGSEGEGLLKKAFPRAFSGDKLDRRALREEVFACPESRERLNAITHPLIHALAIKKIEEAASPVVFFVVPLMFETDCYKLCDKIVAVTCDEQTRARRVCERNGEISPSLALEMVNAQMSEEERAARADEIIRNDGSVEELRKRAEELYERAMNKK